jgi:holo-[acyl-carrier protein] synthase
MMAVLRTGIDLIELERLEQLDEVVRARFLQRVFTPQELEDAAGRLSTLSGRFAAKEAAAKALGCGIGAVSWREIEILRGLAGEPVLKLHGAAAELAARQGIDQWSVSITHNRTTAAAVVVALGMGQGGE